MKVRVTQKGFRAIQLMAVRDGHGSEFMAKNPTDLNVLIRDGLVHQDTLVLTEAGEAWLRDAFAD